MSPAGTAAWIGSWCRSQSYDSAVTTRDCILKEVTFAPPRIHNLNPTIEDEVEGNRIEYLDESSDNETETLDQSPDDISRNTPAYYLQYQETQLTTFNQGLRQDRRSNNELISLLSSYATMELSEYSESIITALRNEKTFPFQELKGSFLIPGHFLMTLKRLGILPAHENKGPAPRPSNQSVERRTKAETTDESSRKSTITFANEETYASKVNMMHPTNPKKNCTM